MFFLRRSTSSNSSASLRSMKTSERRESIEYGHSHSPLSSEPWSSGPAPPARKFSLTSENTVPKERFEPLDISGVLRDVSERFHHNFLLCLFPARVVNPHHVSDVRVVIGSLLIAVVRNHHAISEIGRVAFLGDDHISNLHHVGKLVHRQAIVSVRLFGVPFAPHCQPDSFFVRILRSVTYIPTNVDFLVVFELIPVARSPAWRDQPNPRFAPL